MLLFSNIAEDSDEDVFTVPDVEAAPSGDSAVKNPCSSKVNESNLTDPHKHYSGFSGKRRQGKNPLDKEHRRHKRYVHKYIYLQLQNNAKPRYVLHILAAQYIKMAKKSSAG